MRYQRISRRGYTLMEVLIALTILALVLTVLLGTQSNAVQRGAMANNTTTATLLGRAKMLEIESDLLAEGFNEDEQTFDGDFRQEGFDNFTWEAVVTPIEIDESSSEQLLGQLNGSLFGEGDDGSGGAFTGNAAFAQYLPMVVGLLPDFINRLGQKLRRVTLTLTWPAVSGGTQSLTLVQYVSDLSADQQEDQPPPNLTDDPDGLLNDQEIK